MRSKSILAALVVVTGFACFLRAQEPSAKSDVKKYVIKGSYGTLVYEGKVERRETEKEFKYVIEQLKLRLDPTAKTNSTKEIAAKVIQIVATKKPIEGNGPYTILQRDKKPTTIVLTEDSPTATLKNIKLVLTKESVNEADHIGLGLTDGKILWPIKWYEPASALENASQAN